jgi:hypothetical protein
MSQLHVRTMRNHYRLRGGDSAALRARLGRVLEGVLDEGLDAALARIGIDGEDQICIRRVRAPVRLPAARSDWALATDWSLALADAIELALAGGGANVVRYRSRLHALADFARGVAADDMARAWAWRQLGLLPRGATDSLAAADSALVDALELEGGSVAAVLGALAEARLLQRLSARWSAPQWQRLARAALAAYGMPLRLASGREAETGEDSEDAPQPRALSGTTHVAQPLLARAQRALAGSALAPLLQRAEQDQIRPLLLLALLAVDPWLLRIAPDRLEPVLIALGRAISRAALGSAHSDASAAADPAPAQGAQPRRERAPAEAARGDQRAGGGDAARLDAREAPDEPPGAPTRCDEMASDPVPVAPPAQQVDPRKRGRTQWGGLLFLLRVIGDSGVLDAANEPPLAVRSLRWTLHRLALRLLPLAANDPAALAFVGLSPDAVPPEDEPALTNVVSGEACEFSSAGESFPSLATARRGGGAGRGQQAGESPSKPSPPSGVRGTDIASDQDALDRCRCALVANLRERLAAGEVDDAALLRQVCARRAEILADPGWIEVRLSLDEVSTTIRRCALDLDPGYLPWLGVVVRFVYE